jgi:predicted thioredoxin/glutaredoxin
VIAAKNCAVLEEVVNIGDIKDIMKFGVMSTPAIVIDGKVVSMGKALSVEQIEKRILARK